MRTVGLKDWRTISGIPLQLTYASGETVKLIFI